MRQRHLLVTDPVWIAWRGNWLPSLWGPLAVNNLIRLRGRSAVDDLVPGALLGTGVRTRTQREGQGRTHNSGRHSDYDPLGARAFPDRYACCGHHTHHVPFPDLLGSQPFAKTVGRMVRILSTDQCRWLSVVAVGPSSGWKTNASYRIWSSHCCGPYIRMSGRSSEPRATLARLALWTSC